MNLGFEWIGFGWAADCCTWLVHLLHSPETVAPNLCSGPTLAPSYMQTFEKIPFGYTLLCFTICAFAGLPFVETQLYFQKR